MSKSQVSFSLAFLMLTAPVASFAADRVTVATTTTSAQSWDMYVADQLGLFAAQNLEVIVDSVQPEQLVSELTSGRADMSTPNVYESVLAEHAGQDLKLISGKLDALLYDIAGQSTITNLSDLRGKRIARPSTGNKLTGKCLEDVLLDQGGLAPGDYQIIEVTGGTVDVYKGLQHGDFDAAILTPPYNFQAQTDGFTSLAKFTDTFRAFQFSGSAVSGTFGANHHDVVVRYIKAIIAAQQWLNDPTNKQAAIDLLASKLHIHSTVASQTYTYVIEQNNAFRTNGALDATGMSATLGLMVEMGDLPAGSQWEDYADLSYYNEANAFHGL